MPKIIHPRITEHSEIPVLVKTVQYQATVLRITPHNWVMFLHTVSVENGRFSYCAFQTKVIGAPLPPKPGPSESMREENDPEQLAQSRNVVGEGQEGIGQSCHQKLVRQTSAPGAGSRILVVIVPRRVVRLNQQLGQWRRPTKQTFKSRSSAVHSLSSTTGAGLGTREAFAEITSTGGFATITRPRSPDFD